MSLNPGEEGQTDIFNETGDEASQLHPGYASRDLSFFQIGTLFSTLHTEPAGDISNRSAHNFRVAYGETVHCYIACPITTYNNQGTKKKGCNPYEHAIIHLYGDEPMLLPEEPVLTKHAIAVRPSRADTPSFSQASRIRFGRLITFQSNIKAKGIGSVVEEHIPLLIEYWKEEIGIEHTQTTRARLTESWMAQEDKDMTAESTLSSLYGQTQDSSRRYDIKLDNVDYTLLTQIGPDLHSDFEVIRKPKAFFNRGRIFMVLWPKITSDTDAERAIHLKVRRFVCIRPKTTSCLCLPIHTYGGQATTKRGVLVDEHAPIIPIGRELQLHPNEKLSNKPLYIKVEDPKIDIDPMARLNFGSIMTIEHNLRVRNVGRVVAESLRRLEECFTQSLKLDKT